MRILYQIPSPETIYAARFIYEGYKDAFTDLGFKFRPFTSNDDLKKILKEYKPDIFISSLNNYYLQYLDLDLLKKYRKKGLVFFNQLQPWKKQNDQFGGGDLRSQTHLVELIKKGLAGDIFFHWFEQDDPFMDGFTKTTGYKFHTILLAANIKKYFYDYSQNFYSQISYVGSFLPSKRDFINKHFIPLMKKYKVKVYGSDWDMKDRLLGYIQKAGQYFNINFLKSLRNVKLPINDERKVYSSSLISLNIHENHQRKFGTDFNERTFKIIASGGFEICDNVKNLKKYFNKNELVIGENTKDWFDKIDYYIKNPKKRLPVIEAGKKKVLKEHTYHNRVRQIIDIYNNFKK